MKRVFARRIVLLAGLLLAGGIATVLLSSAAGPSAPPAGQAPTDPWEIYLFGGPGDQYGTAVAIRGSQVIVGGEYNHGWLRSYPIPMSPTPQWTLVESNHQPFSLATTSTDLYSIGAAFPPTCGASDGSGGTEAKVMFARYTLSGTTISCGSYNFFPYRGYEWYFASASNNEGGIDYVYAGGNAEQAGWAYSGPFVLAKYDAFGNIVKAVTEPGINLDTPYTDPRKGMSNIHGLAVANGNLYAAGESWLPYLYEDTGSWDWGQRPVLMKYDFDLGRIWKYRANIAPGYSGYSGQFHAVTTLDDYVYAVGRAVPAGGIGGYYDGFDFLVEKFDELGARIWSTSWGGAFEDSLRGIVAVGNRLFAVGYTYETTHSGYKDGESDVVIFEINPTDGCWTLIDRIGGDGVEWATGVATDGHDLYIVGHSTSFASDEGNNVGDLEIMLIHYRLNRAPVANDQTVGAEWGVAEDITLTASDEDGDDLTYSIVDPPLHGTLSGEAPNVTYTSECTYFGPDSFTFKANDGTVDSNIATVSITVNKAFAFVGFDPPIDNIPVVNSAKAGSTVPVKWRITDKCGTPISDPGSFRSLTSSSVDCDSLLNDPVDPVETYAGASGLQYLGDGYWQFNWKTPKSYAGQCRVMVLTLKDGTTHSANFKFQ